MTAIHGRAGLRMQVFVTGIGAVMLLLGAVQAGHATNVIDGCSQTCEIDCGADPNCREASGGKCILTGDVTCDSTESAIELLSGNDLQMAGYDITCTETSPNSCPYAAILIIDSSSKVTSDGSGDDGESEISGRFNFGIDCDLNEGSIVEKIAIFDGFAAVRDCKIVRETVIGSSSQFIFSLNFGILTEGIGGNDAFTKNYIQGRVEPIHNNGSNSLSVDQNVIQTDAATTALALGNPTGGADGTAKFNIFFGGGVDSSSTLFSITGTDSLVYLGNYCDGDHPDCADCIAAGRCQPYTAPFRGN